MFMCRQINADAPRTSSARTTVSVAMCFSGGGYLRLLPYFIIKNKFMHYNTQKKPVMVYLHPRDFDPNTPRLKMPYSRAFKCYINLRSTKKKFGREWDHESNESDE